jgi:membrane protease YdiL (CAAX protease family)
MVELFINKLLSGVMQVFIVAIIPIIWWTFTARKKVTFFEWIGIKKANNPEKNLWRLVIFTVAGFIIISIGILFLLKGVETATSDFYDMGIGALPAALVYAFFNTALSEELLFRGFLLKRFSNKFGFTIGNILQGTLFGLLHGIMFISLVGVVKAILIITFTGTLGWCMGYLNEQKANGSILPSWIIHGISNTFSAIIAMFSII